MEIEHKPVLLKECIESLNINSQGIYVDCTLGGAGHSTEIYKKLSEKGLLIGIDQDDYALEAARKRLGTVKEQGHYILVKNNFKNLANICAELEIDKVNGVLVDLGVSSFQLDFGDRGFSYQKDSQLDMRMDVNNELTAEFVVNKYDKDRLIKIIRDYGEEKWAVRIVNFIVEQRKLSPIRTTHELVKIIKQAIPHKVRMDGPHPAKRTFQAIRIEVNDELNVLEKLLAQIVDLLVPGGRACCITFHSLEDRIVKRFIQKMVNPCTCPGSFPVCVCNKKSTCKNVYRKPIIPTNEELEYNPRARSAKLRVIEKLDINENN